MRIKALILCFTLIFSTIPTFNVFASTEVDEDVIYFCENFDSASGSTVSSMEFTPGKNEISVVGEDSGNKAALIQMKCTADSVSDAALIKRFNETKPTGKFVIEFDMKLEDLGGCSPRLALRSPESNGSEIYPIEITSGRVLGIGGVELIGSIAEGKYYKFALAFDIDKGTYDVYINGLRKKQGIDFKSSLTYKFDELFLILFNTRYASAGCKTKYWVDDIKVYKGKKPLSEDKFNSKSWELAINRDTSVSAEMVKYGTQDKLVLYENAPKALVNGDPTPIDSSNNAVVPFIVNGTTLLPARFIVESLGGTIEYDEVKRCATANIDGKTIVITEGSKTMLVDGEEKQLLEAARVKDGRFFVPLRALGEAVEKEVFWDKTGLIVLSDEEFKLNWRDDASYLTAIVASMIYERPSGNEILSKMKAKFPNNAHPRIMVDGNTFEELKRQIATNPTKKRWYDEIKKEADSYLDIEPVKFSTTAKDWTDYGVKLKDMAPCLALVYRIEGDKKYADRVIAEMEQWVAQDKWAHYSMLGLGRAANGFGFAYDWLYDVIPDDLKTQIKEKLKDEFFAEVFKDYYNITPRDRSYSWTLGKYGDNWNTTINSGVIMLALAFGDEVGYEDMCAEALTEAVISLEAAFNQLGPDGAWYEGAGYWTPTVEGMVWAMESLRNACGTDYGLFNAPGMKFAGNYLYEMSASSGIFNFNFANYRGYPCPILLYYADRLGDTSLKKIAIDHYEKFKGETGIYMTADALILSGELPPEDMEVSLPLDSYYRGVEAVSMRSSWDPTKELYAGFHSGYNGAQNAQLDIGTFVIESLGERFITDFGPENYTLTPYIFQAYMNRAEGANAYIVNPSEDIMDQVKEAYCYFDRYETNEVSAYAITDMTAAYGNKLKSAKRGMKMTNNRTAVILQDEIVANEPSDIYWGMHTPATVTLSEDKKTAILEIRGNRMEAKIMSEQGEFSLDKPVSLPESFQLAGQTEHPGVTKLAMRFKDATNVNIAICFTPLGYADNVDIKYPKMAKLDDWCLDEVGEAPTTIVPDMSDVVLDELKIDGKMVNNFNPDTKTYNHTVDSRTGPVPTVTATSKYPIDIKYPDTWPGNIKLEVTSEGGTIEYEIIVNAPPETPYDHSHNELKPIAWDVDILSQPENGPDSSMDHNFDTRMALATPNYVIYDLGEEKNIDKVVMSFYNGAARKTMFDIEISNDNENWTKVFDGESSGKTIKYEYFNIGMQKARYIKINGKGTSTGEAWLSITEMRLFGAK